MITATEVLIRQIEYNERMDPMRKMIDHMASSLFKQMFDTRVPLIKYGRRKRGYRRIFPGQFPAVRITFNGSEVTSAPVATDHFYRSY